MTETTGEPAKVEGVYHRGETSSWKVILAVLCFIVAAPAVFLLLRSAETVAEAVSVSGPSLPAIGQTVLLDATIGCRQTTDIDEVMRLQRAYGNWNAAQKYAEGRCRPYGAGLTVRVIERDGVLGRVCIAHNDEYPCNWVLRQAIKP